MYFFVLVFLSGRISTFLVQLQHRYSHIPVCSVHSLVPRPSLCTFIFNFIENCFRSEGFVCFYRIWTSGLFGMLSCTSMFESTSAPATQTRLPCLTTLLDRSYRFLRTRVEMSGSGRPLSAAWRVGMDRIGVFTCLMKRKFCFSSSVLRQAGWKNVMIWYIYMIEFTSVCGYCVILILLRY